MIQYASGGKESFSGKRVAISGSGNVAQYAALKIIELGGTVVSLSDSKGALIAEDDDAFTPEVIDTIAKLKLERKQLSELIESADFKNKYKYIEDARPWTHVGNVDVALPSATQNEVSGEEAEALVKAGCKFIAEGSNMGCTQEAIDHFEKVRKEKKAEAIWYAPGKSRSPTISPPSPPPPTPTNAPLPYRQGRQRRWRGRLRSRDGAELAAHPLDERGGGPEAEGHHGELLPQLPRDSQGVHHTGRGRVPQLGRWREHCRFHQGCEVSLEPLCGTIVVRDGTLTGDQGDERPGRLVVKRRERVMDVGFGAYYYGAMCTEFAVCRHFFCSEHSIANRPRETARKRRLESARTNKM